MIIRWLSDDDPRFEPSKTKLKAFGRSCGGSSPQCTRWHLQLRVTGSGWDKHRLAPQTHRSAYHARIHKAYTFTRLIGFPQDFGEKKKHILHIFLQSWTGKNRNQIHLQICCPGLTPVPSSFASQISATQEWSWKAPSSSASKKFGQGSRHWNKRQLHRVLQRKKTCDISPISPLQLCCSFAVGVDSKASSWDMLQWRTR